jgi:hypothetical protein
MTPETKTEARERMSTEAIHRMLYLAGDVTRSNPSLERQRVDAVEAMAQIESALSALRAEHAKTLELAASWEKCADDRLRAIERKDEEQRALRAEHQRTQAQAAALAESLRDRAVENQGDGLVCLLCGADGDRESVTHKPGCALASDAGKGWVSPEEHQRVVAESSKLRGEFLRHEMHIIGATKERDEARAALAASEERARGMEAALRKAGGHGFGACKCKAFDHCVVDINETIDRALSSSTAPGAAPKPPPPARWCALCDSPPEKQPGTIDGEPCPTCGDFRSPAPRVGAESEEAKR